MTSRYLHPARGSRHSGVANRSYGRRRSRAAEGRLALPHGRVAGQSDCVARHEASRKLNDPYVDLTADSDVSWTRPPST